MKEIYRAITRDTINSMIALMKNNFTIVVGDANGVDKQIQKFCHSMNYNKVFDFKIC